MKKLQELFKKAQEKILDYNRVTGSSICIYDNACNPQFLENTGVCPEKQVCPYCATFQSGREAFPCHEMHKNAIKEAEKKGSFYTYQCNLGFVFWVSPIYTDGGFSGAIRGGGFLAAERFEEETKKTVDISLNANDTFVMRNNEISEEELKKRINSFPEADRERVQSMAEMMQIYAESLSSGSLDYHDIIKRRAEQQEAISQKIEEIKAQFGENNDNAKKTGYPLEKEKKLMSALRKGDTAETKNALNELLAMLFFLNSGQFKYIQLRVIELVVLISRIEINPVKNGNLLMEINSQNLKMVQEAKTVEELTDILHTIVDRVSDNISSFIGIPHAAALRKAENFIMENYTRKISLKEIAGIAGLSPPYFSTIFKEEMGENLSKYLNRLRVEKASLLLLETAMSLSEIAACCCFEDQSWFSKIFKAYTGISPGKYRNQGGRIIKNASGNDIAQDLGALLDE